MTQINLTTPAQRRLLRNAWIHGSALNDLGVRSRTGGAIIRAAERMVAWKWLDRRGSWKLTDRGREIAGMAIAQRPEFGDALRLHLEDRGQDIVYLDVAVTHLPWAKIINSPQFWMWGKYEASNSKRSPVHFRRGNLVDLALRADVDAQTQSRLQPRVTLGYRVESVEFLGIAKTVIETRATVPA